MKGWKKDVRQVRIYTRCTCLFLAAANSLCWISFKIIHLDNILLKYADKTITPEHRSLVKIQPSVDCVLSPSCLQLHQNPHKLEVGSTVQYGEPVEYGVVKWIGSLPGREKLLYAGVEMVSYSVNM